MTDPAASNPTPRPDVSRSHRVEQPIGLDTVPLQGPLPAGAATHHRVALFVSHGMGQQVPFETLDSIAHGLLDVLPIPHAGVRARTVQVGDNKLQRLEIDTRDSHGKDIEVHIYEAYWAPLTEGAVTLADVIRFLLSSGWNGLVNSFADFRRWMFGNDFNFGAQSHTAWQLLTALGIILSLMIMNSVIAAIVGASLLNPGGSTSWPNGELLGVFNTIMVSYSVYSALFFVTLLMSPHIRPNTKTATSPSWWRAVTALLDYAFRLWVLGTLAAGLLFICAIANEQLGVLDLQPLEEHLLSGHGWLWFWAVLLLVSRQVSRLLVQYMGDVAAYVSSHSLDRFSELRQKIKKVACDVAKSVYSAASKEGGYLYSRVCVIGHSLGSVIAYDTLNALLIDDELARTRLGVAERTKLLLTFGSPLDKVAFIFARPKATTHQRALAASVQPLIQSYERFRRMKWVNIYSARDVVSGRLDFFDVPDHSSGGGCRVQSVPDPEARIPLIAHTEYWRSRLLFDYIFRNL